MRDKTKILQQVTQQKNKLSQNKSQNKFSKTKIDVTNYEEENKKTIKKVLNNC